MSQAPPNWPQQPGGENPFSDRGQSPFGPGGPYPGPFNPPPRIEDDPAMRWVLPVGTSVWAIAAGYLGLFSLICFPAPLALLCGIVAVYQLRKNPRLSGWGRAILGIVLGTLGSIGLAFFLVALAAGH